MSLCRRSLALIKEQSGVQNIITYTIRTASTRSSTSTKDKGAGNSGKETGGGSDGSVYKVPEYFQYNDYSYYDIDRDMVKYRLEQPHPGGKY